jgi:hypothetical protein
VRPPQFDDLLGGFAVQSVSYPVRHVTPIGQPGFPFLFVPPLPLVPDRPGNPIPPAQFGHRPVLLPQLLDKLRSLIHDTTLFPWHAAFISRLQQRSSRFVVPGIKL